MRVREGGERVRQVRGAGIGHLSWQGMTEEGVFSQITGTRSLYRSRTRADSATRCSKECSRLCAKLIRIVLDGPNGAPATAGQALGFVNGLGALTGGLKALAVQSLCFFYS